MRLAVCLIFVVLSLAAAPGCGRRPPRSPSGGPYQGGRQAVVPASERPSSAASARMTVRDVRLRDPDTPVVAGEIEQGGLTVDIVAAPALSADWVVLALSRTAPLRRCAELTIEHDRGAVTAPLASFDPSGHSVRYELPLSGLLRAAFSQRVRIRACDVDLGLPTSTIGELRRHALFTLYRRSQVAPELALPEVFNVSAGDRPPWISQQSGEITPLRATLQIDPATRVTFVFDSEHAQRIVVGLTEATRWRALEDCEIELEVGPAAVRARRTAVNEAETQARFEIHDLGGFLALGVVDTAAIHYCGRTRDLANMLAALRRLVLAISLSRATSADSLGVDLPPGPASESPGVVLPQAREPEHSTPEVLEPPTEGAANEAI
jgi:hypothetical protein